MTENSTNFLVSGKYWMHSDEDALQTAVLDCAALTDIFLVGLPQWKKWDRSEH